MGTNVLTSRQGSFLDWESDKHASFTTGILPSQEIRHLLATERVICRTYPPISDAQIQPASLDLRLGETAYRVQASFLPGQFSKVEDKIKELKMTRIDLNREGLLERGGIYIVPLMEELDLPAQISGKANPKSTTGRLDIFTRLITDYGSEFEFVPAGYKGKLFAEIVPRTFSIRVRAGMRLSQLRFTRGKPSPADSVIAALNQESPLVYHNDDNPAEANIDRGLKISVNLVGNTESEIVAYKAKKNTPAIDLANIDHYAPEEFWDAKRSVGKKGLILDPGDFYILASKERICVPPQCAAEMVAIDPSIGEFRIHYAGFFDPGFGYGTGELRGTRAVLEVRAHEVPFLIEDGQIVGRLTYMRLLSCPDIIYGAAIGSSYQRQALTLSKQFKRDIEAAQSDSFS